MLLFSNGVNAQYEAQFRQVAHLPYKDKVVWIDTFYRNLIQMKDSSTVLAASRSLREFGKKERDPSLVLEASLFDAYYFARENYGTSQQIITRFKRLADEGQKKRYFHITARAIYATAEYYWNNIQNFELAFEQYIELNQILSGVDQYEFPNTCEYLYVIGKAYYTFKDYGKALYYLKKAAEISISTFNRNAYWATCNTIGLCYQQMGNLDSSDHYYWKVLESPLVNPEDAYYTIVQGNIGYNYFLKKEYDKALPLLRKDVQRALQSNDYSWATGSAITISDIYITQGKLEKARMLIDSIYNFINISKEWPRLQRLYPIISRYYAAKRNLLLSNKYLDTALRFSDSMQGKFSALLLARAQQKKDQEQLQARDKEYRLERKLNRMQRILFITLAILLISLAIFIYYRLNKRAAERREEQERKLQAYEEELSIAKMQLAEFVKKLYEKNALIEKLENSGMQKLDNETLQYLQKSVILTEEDWVKFRQAFDVVHHGFINRVKERYRQITPAELRILVLSRLNFSTREMATALGISPNSVRVTWHRLRRKLNLPEDTQLEVLAHTI